MSCSIGHRCSLYPALLWLLLWLWHRPAAAAPIQPPAWEFPYATDAALNKGGKKKKKLKLEPTYDPAIPLLGIYPEETIIQKDTCIFAYNSQDMEGN